MKVNYELLREVYCIVGGIPDEAVDLSRIVKKQGPSLDCGTVACAIGWLSMHPKFQAMGLTSERTGDLSYTYYKGEMMYYAEAASRIFGFSTETAHKIFQPRNFDDGNGPTDKQVFLKRLSRYLGSRGQLDQPMYPS